MNLTELKPRVEGAALKHGVSASLVLALIEVESGGNTYAWNPEPQYRYLWNVRTKQPFRQLTLGESRSELPPADFPTLAADRDQEWWGQQASWGLMQIMGAVARERGFTGPYLTELCDPVVNLTYGVAHLASLLRWSKGNVEQALAAYNGGRGGNSKPPYRNAAYAAKVMACLRQ